MADDRRCALVVRVHQLDERPVERGQPKSLEALASRDHATTGGADQVVSTLPAPQPLPLGLPRARGSKPYGGSIAAPLPDACVMELAWLPTRDDYESRASAPPVGGSIPPGPTDGFT